jgi:hypothetical protein
LNTAQRLLVEEKHMGAGTEMEAPKEMDVIRLAYELWQRAGEPSGKDDELYYMAKEKLRQRPHDGS